VGWQARLGDAWPVVAGLIVIMFFAATAWLYVAPSQDRVGRVDAVVVLGGGDITARARLGQRLVERITAAQLVVSVTGARDCLKIFGSPLPSGITCFRPSPFSTQGEARYAAALAHARGWRSLAVVTSPDQLRRARLRFARCFHGSLRSVATSTPVTDRLSRLPYEWAATAKALLWQRGC